MKLERYSIQIMLRDAMWWNILLQSTFIVIEGKIKRQKRPEAIKNIKYKKNWFSIQSWRDIEKPAVDKN